MFHFRKKNIVIFQRERERERERGKKTPLGRISDYQDDA
jgi:hypothetical protein